MNQESSRTKNRLTLVIVLLVFCVPFLMSWWFINYTDVIEEGKKSNHGDLVIPARPLPDLDLVDPLKEGRTGKLHGKWSFFYIAQDECDQSCIDNLYRMRQVRLTAGKDDHRVQRVLLVTGNGYPPKKIFNEYEGQWLVNKETINIDSLLNNFRLTEKDQPEKMQRLYIVDPLGNLMMSYPGTAEPRGIIKDLKKLLKTSKIG